MESKANIYRSLRRETPYLPALMAWRTAQSQIDLHKRIRETGFAWEGNFSLEQKAAWEEQGFTLTARVVSDDLGWYEEGVECLGQFQEQWEPGAIEHDRSNPRIFAWFVPAYPENGKALYRRACTYGHDWSYIGIEVSAHRAGVELGTDSMWGIESDTGEDYFTQVAFDLADEAIVNANKSLKDLCGCN